MNEKAFETVSSKAKSDEYVLAEFGSRQVSSAAGHRVISNAGADRWHNIIVSNAAIGIGSRIHGQKNEMYISNMPVLLNKELICYPDIVIVTDAPVFADSKSSLLKNPAVVIEIFTSRTDSVDKTKKLESFLEIDSVKEYVLIKQDEMRVEHYARQNKKQWTYRIYNERDDVVTLDAVNCKISLQEIFAQIKFDRAALSSSAIN